MARTGRTRHPRSGRGYGPTQKVQEIRIQPERLRGIAPRRDHTFLEGVFALYGKNKGKNLVGNKTPAYVKGLPVLHAHWPTAKFIHLFRDGRDVCLSVLSWYHADRTAGRYSTWALDPVSTTALWWKHKVGLGRQAGQSLGQDLYYEIRYESLVTHPTEECAKLCSFLGVPYDEVMLRFHEGRTKSDPGLDAKRAWRPITPGLRDWKTQMGTEDIERFEAAAGDLLDQLGYPRAVPHPRADIMNRAARICDLFTQDLQSRGKVLQDRS
jgi:hypothetical protein